MTRPIRRLLAADAARALRRAGSYRARARLRRQALRAHNALRLALWDVGPDTVCAYSAGDALEVLSAYYHPHDLEYAPAPTRMSDDAVHVVRFEHVDDLPPWSPPYLVDRFDEVVTLAAFEAGSTLVSAPARVWAHYERRGLLSSTEY